MTVKERLIEFIKWAGISQRAFEKEIGLSNGYVNNIRKSIQPDKLQRIVLIYPMFNTGWLITGEGEMLKTGNNNPAPSDMVSIPREVLDQISRLTETVLSQQKTIELLTAQIEKLVAATENKPV